MKCGTCRSKMPRELFVCLSCSQTTLTQTSQLLQSKKEILIQKTAQLRAMYSQHQQTIQSLHTKSLLQQKVLSLQLKKSETHARIKLNKQLIQQTRLYLEQKRHFLQQMKLQSQQQLQEQTDSHQKLLLSQEKTKKQEQFLQKKRQFLSEKATHLLKINSIYEAFDVMGEFELKKDGILEFEQDRVVETGSQMVSFTKHYPSLSPLHKQILTFSLNSYAKLIFCLSKINHYVLPISMYLHKDKVELQNEVNMGNIQYLDLQDLELVGINFLYLNWLYLVSSSGGSQTLFDIKQLRENPYFDAFYKYSEHTPHLYPPARQLSQCSLKAVDNLDFQDDDFVVILE